MYYRPEYEDELHQPMANFRDFSKLTILSYLKEIV